MKFVATKTAADQLDLQAPHRVRERLVSQRTGIINQIRAFLLERGIAVIPTSEWPAEQLRCRTFRSQRIWALCANCLYLIADELPAATSLAKLCQSRTFALSAARATKPR
jgi:transposase